jgi:hypothetical protein
MPSWFACLSNCDIGTLIDGHVFETAIVDYRLSFADKGKQTSVFCFPLAANKRKLAFLLVPFSV